MRVTPEQLRARRMAELAASEAKAQLKSANVLQVTPEHYITKAKEARFTLSSRLLGRKPISVKVVNNAQAQPATYNVKTNELTLNEAWPNSTDNVEALIYDRAKLYHELGHARFTSAANNREALCKSAKNAQSFLALSNILEDGRIERLLKIGWPGSADFLDSLLAAVVKDAGDSPIDGLIQYVRCGKFRNVEEARYWQPYKARIDEAIKAKSTRKVCEIAFEISEAISQADAQQAKPPTQQGEGKAQQADNEQQSEQAEDNASAQDEEEAREDESEQDASEGEESSEDADSNKGEGESADEESDADEEGEAEDAEEGEGEGEGTGDDKSDSSEATDSKTSASQQSEGCNEKSKADNEEDLSEQVLDEEAVKQISEDAKQACEEEAGSDWQAILDEAEIMNGAQCYASEAEESASEDIAMLLNSLAVETARVRFHASRSGLLNTSALASALTTRRCFHTKEEALSAPYVALLLDLSASMSYNRQALTNSARTLNGALRKAGVNVKVITYQTDDYDNNVVKLSEYKSIPAETTYGSVSRPFYFKCGGGTPTGAAMRVANDWLEAEGATRALMIVATDGEPNSKETVMAERQRCESNGGFVLGVLLGGYSQEQADYRSAGYDSPFENQFTELACVPQVADLASALEAPLASFLAGA